MSVYHIPQGTLELPEPPPGHAWSVKNVITTTDDETLYSVKVHLMNPDNVPVATVSETWNRKIEQYNDFAVSIVGLAQVELGSYLAFSAIDWGRDNPSLEVETFHNKNQKTLQWSNNNTKQETEL